MYGSFRLPGDGPALAKLIFFAALVAVFGIVSYRVLLPLKTVKLVDDHLIISSIVKRAKIPVSEIYFVDGPDKTSLRRITIEFNSPTPIGKSVTFSPPFFKAKRIARFLRRLESDHSESNTADSDSADQLTPGSAWESSTANRREKTRKVL